MAQQCNLSAERWWRGLFQSAASDVAVVETLSVQCFQKV